MLNRKQLELLISLCEDNEELQQGLKDFCNAIYEELGEINRKFRNELSILSGTEKLSEEKDEEAASQHSRQQVQESYLRFSNLLGDYEHLRSNFLLKFSHVDIEQLCQKVASTFQATAFSNHIAFTFENHMKQPDTLSHYICDAYKMQEAIMNILKHIFAHSQESTYIKLTLQDDTPTHFCICAERDGIPFSPETMHVLNAQDISRETYLQYTPFLETQQYVKACKGTLEQYSSPEKTYCLLRFPYDLNPNEVPAKL